LHRRLAWFELARGHWEFDGKWTHALPWRWKRFELGVTLGPPYLHVFRRRTPELPEPEEYTSLHAIDGGKED
jgi:hypothetical protein